MDGFDRVLSLCVGKTVAEMGGLYECGERIGVRIMYTDGTVVQFVYEGTEEGFVAQEVEG